MGTNFSLPVWSEDAQPTAGSSSPSNRHGCDSKSVENLPASSPPPSKVSTLNPEASPFVPASFSAPFSSTTHDSFTTVVHKKKKTVRMNVARKSSKQATMPYKKVYTTKFKSTATSHSKSTSCEHDKADSPSPSP